MAAALSHNYSLWLELPPGPVRARLATEIARQADARGGPRFEAHVTLLADVQQDEQTLIDTTAALAKRIKPLRINFLDVTCGASFHQCVYILCAKEPALLAANAAAREAFGKPEPPKPYMPHLSLLYSDVDDAAREAAASEAVKRLWGEGSGYETLLPEAGFEAGSVSLWYTPVEDLSLKSWRRVAEFKLTGEEASS